MKNIILRHTTIKLLKGKEKNLKAPEREKKAHCKERERETKISVTSETVQARKTVARFH